MIQNWVQRHSVLLLIITAYVILTSLNSITIPLSKAPDEYVHFLYSRFIAENGRLPVTVEERQIAGYKADQPPLYYGLVALVTGWIEINDLPTLKMTWDSSRRNLVDIILPRAMIVRTEDETWPYRSEILAWMVGRWLSVALGAVTIVLVYVIGLEIFSDDNPRCRSIQNPKTLALAAAAVLAFIPRFTFISAVLNDETLLAVIISLYFWGIVRWVKEPSNIWNLVVVGLMMGLAVTSKYSAVVLPLEFLIVLIIVAWHKKQHWQEWARVLIITVIISIFASAWWFVFQTQYFNQIDELGWLAGTIRPIIAGDETEPGSTTFFVAGVLTGTAAEADNPKKEVEGSVWDWITLFFTEFWEVEVYGQLPLYPPIFTVVIMLGICLMAAIGWGMLWKQNQGRHRLWFMTLLLHIFIFLLIPFMRYLINGRIHDTAQARYVVFSAAPAVGILLVWGMAALTGKKYQQWGLVGLVSVMLTLSVARLYHYNKAFPPPLPVRADPTQTAEPEYPLSVVFDDGLQLAGYNWELLNKANSLAVTLYWQSLAYATEDYRMELSLLDGRGQIVAQTTAHPARGRYPVRAWDPGDNIRSEITLPLVGLTSGTYGLQLRLVGWQDPLLTADSAEAVDLGQIDLSNHLVYSSSQRFVSEHSLLTGFDIWQNGKIVSGQPTYRYLAAIPVTLTGNTTPEMEARLWLVGPDGQRRIPLAGVGQSYTFIVDYDWPSGLYRLEAELWQSNELLDTAVSDTILMVKNRPIIFDPPPMDYRVDANFDNTILLLGYDLPTRRVQPGQGLPVVLHWQALQRTKESYVIFDRLLDQNQQVWGGYDRLPQEIYDTFLWVPGEVVSDGFAVPVDPQAPAGIYHLHVGLYQQKQNQTESLPLVQNGEAIETTSVTIGPIKVGGPPPDTIVTDFAAQTLRHDMLGEPPVVSLQGYDLDQEENKLHLTLYWRSEAQTDVNYTTFVHLKDEQDRVVAQKDGPTGSGLYPTSLWDTGEIIADTITLSVPPESSSGEYTLTIGLYQLETGQRLAAPASVDNSLQLTFVKLEQDR